MLTVTHWSQPRCPTVQFPVLLYINTGRSPAVLQYNSLYCCTSTLVAAPLSYSFTAQVVTVQIEETPPLTLTLVTAPLSYSTIPCIAVHQHWSQPRCPTVSLLRLSQCRSKRHPPLILNPGIAILALITPLRQGCKAKSTYQPNHCRPFRANKKIWNSEFFLLKSN